MRFFLSEESFYELFIIFDISQNVLFINLIHKVKMFLIAYPFNLRLEVSYRQKKADEGQVEIKVRDNLKSADE